MKGLLPTEHYHYKFDVMSQRVYFTALDGTDKQIDNQSLRILPLDRKPNEPEDQPNTNHHRATIHIHPFIRFTSPPRKKAQSKIVME